MEDAGLRTRDLVARSSLRSLSLSWVSKLDTYIHAVNLLSICPFPLPPHTHAMTHVVSWRLRKLILALASTAYMSSEDRPSLNDFICLVKLLPHDVDVCSKQALLCIDARSLHPENPETCACLYVRIQGTRQCT